MGGNQINVIERKWSGSDGQNLGGSRERRERVSWVERSRVVCRWIVF